MRLINTETKELKEFLGDSIPAYAILSHIWGSDANEVNFQDLQRYHAEREQFSTSCIHPVALKSGFHKLEGCCDQARRDSFDWAWIDTCCIDKTSSAELSEAINSMFSWYKNSAVCYAYLVDVCAVDGPNIADGPNATNDSTFRKSRWFRRGWTLQELLAPRVLRFFDQSWNIIGQLGADAMLKTVVGDITKIPLSYLCGRDLRLASVAQRMSWAANRVTTRKEDVAYSLLGIFDVNMPLLYGEGERAFIRLQEEIFRTHNDHTLLAWGFGSKVDQMVPDMEQVGLFANSPELFTCCEKLVPFTADARLAPAIGELTSHALQLPMKVGYFGSSWYALLECSPVDDLFHQIAIPLREIKATSASNINKLSRLQPFSFRGPDCFQRTNSPVIKVHLHRTWSHLSDPRESVTILRNPGATAVARNIQQDFFGLLPVVIIPPSNFNCTVLHRAGECKMNSDFFGLPLLFYVGEDPRSRGEIWLHLRECTPNPQNQYIPDEFIARFRWFPGFPWVKWTIGSMRPSLPAHSDDLQRFVKKMSRKRLKLRNNTIKTCSRRLFTSYGKGYMAIRVESSGTAPARSRSILDILEKDNFASSVLTVPYIILMNPIVWRSILTGCLCVGFALFHSIWAKGFLIPLGICFLSKPREGLAGERVSIFTEIFCGLFMLILLFFIVLLT